MVATPRHVFIRCFPNLGYYNFTGIGEAEIHSRDTIGDLVDIANAVSTWTPQKTSGRRDRQLDSQRSDVVMGDPVRYAPETGAVSMESAPNGVSFLPQSHHYLGCILSLGFCPFRGQEHARPVSLCS